MTSQRLQATRRIGFYGGTFDPIHRGHLEPVASIVEAMQWDEVVFLPAFRQPLKERRASSPFHRYAMTVLGTSANRRFRCSPMELERGEVSFTVDTVEILRKVNPTATIDWIIGEDNLAVLSSWRNPSRILELANFVVLRRGAGVAAPAAFEGYLKTAAERGNHGAIVLADNVRVDVSASEIRKRVAEGRDYADLVTPEVVRYMELYDLYRPEVLN